MSVTRLSDPGWIKTNSGKMFFPLSPSVSDIDINDIAHALSLICRFNGHAGRFYSVAEHCIGVSRMVPPEHALWGLLHDASEAYMCDMTSPVKHHPGMWWFRECEETLQKAICRRFGLPPEMPECVHRADKEIMEIERRELFGPDIRMARPDPEETKNWYLARFGELYDGE